MSIHDVIAKHLKVDHFEQQLFCGCGFRLWHPGTGFGDPSTVHLDHQTVAEAALAWHLAKEVQEYLDVASASMAEFRDRLHRAESTLLALIDATNSASPERARLKGKLQGVRLALGYLRETT